MTNISSTKNSLIDPHSNGRPVSSRGGAGHHGRSSGGADPFPQPGRELDSAIQRLRTLLTFDGHSGPREDVRSRGFYLNILV